MTVQWGNLSIYHNLSIISNNVKNTLIKKNHNGGYEILIKKGALHHLLGYLPYQYTVNGHFLSLRERLFIFAEYKLCFMKDTIKYVKIKGFFKMENHFMLYCFLFDLKVPYCRISFNYGKSQIGI